MLLDTISQQSNDNFYADLQILYEFTDITDSSNFVAVPEDWQIIITDIVNSTKQVENGRYKDVNLIGASTIVAILNIAKHLDIPFVFGGDGASILVPPSLIEAAKQALTATQNLALQVFNMKLRIGIVPVHKISDRYEIKVAKLQISPSYDQAIFKGGGLTHATNLVKEINSIYTLESTPNLDLKPDLSGLECRWQDIPSRHGEIVTLMILANSTHEIKSDHVYKQAIAQIKLIYGEDHECHPAPSDRLNLTFDHQKLILETKVQGKSQNWRDRLSYLIKIQLQNLLAWFLIKFKYKTKTMNWGKFKNHISTTTDYKKFDDILRMIVSGNPSQRERLISYLEQQYTEGTLAYGFHVSDRALMTCLVFERNGRQVHFVDGADGGYTYAAKVMKQKIKGIT